MWSQVISPRWVVGKAEGTLKRSAARLKSAASLRADRQTAHGSLTALPLTRATCNAASLGGLLRAVSISQRSTCVDWQLLVHRNPSCSSTRCHGLGHARGRLLSSLAGHEQKQHQEQLDEQATLLDEVNQREVHGAVQDLVQTIVESGDEVLLSNVTKLVDLHFQKMARIHSLKIQREPALEGVERQRFLTSMTKLLTTRFKDSNLQSQLLERLDLCHGHVEILHDRLWWSSCQAADDGLLGMEDEETDMDDTHLAEFFERTEKPPPVGTESRPMQERWVLDVDVAWMRQSSQKYCGPVADRSIIFSNLPTDTTEDDVRAALSPCGPVISVDLCTEWLDWQARLESQKDAELETKTPEVKPAPPPYTLLYAIVQFERPEARQLATKELPRICGILLREVRLTKKKTRTVPKVVGRACYPQDVRVKRTLLLRNISWTLEPWQVLEACCGVLAKAGIKCRLSLSNCKVFGQRGDGNIQQLEVRCSAGSEPDVIQVPERYSNVDSLPAGTDTLIAPRERGGNGGVAVLRFESFEDAYMALQELRSLKLEGRRIYCGFAPWRPACQPTDSRGRHLQEALLLDLPVPRASAFYGPEQEGRDPVLRYGYTEETMLAWSRSPE